MSQLSLPVHVRDNATFKNFYSGDNAEIITHLQEIFSQTHFEPIYLWGASGSGRTHLLQACCHLATEKNYSNLYCSLTNINTLSPAIFENIETIQFICIDDIEMMANHSNWQEAFFHLYNRLKKTNQLIVTANTPPSSLPFSLPDLISRLSASVIFHLKPLTDEQKAQTLQIRAHLRGLELSDHVVHFLLNHFSRDTSELLKLLEKLDQISLIEKHKLTIPFIKKIFQI